MFMKNVYNVYIYKVFFESVSKTVSNKRIGDNEPETCRIRGNKMSDRLKKKYYKDFSEKLGKGFFLRFFPSAKSCEVFVRKRSEVRKRSIIAGSVLLEGDRDQLRQTVCVFDHIILLTIMLVLLVI